MDEKDIPRCPLPSTLNTLWTPTEDGIFTMEDGSSYVVGGVKRDEEGEVIKQGVIRKVNKTKPTSKERRQLRKAHKGATTQ